MSFGTICDISYLALAMIVLGVPAWMVFAPPRAVRSWPSLCRPPLAFVTAQAFMYTLWYGFIYPASNAFLQAHPGDLICGILCGRPSTMTIPIVIVTLVYFLLRALFLACRSKWVARQKPG